MPKKKRTVYRDRRGRFVSRETWWNAPEQTALKIWMDWWKYAVKYEKRQSQIDNLRLVAD